LNSPKAFVIYGAYGYTGRLIVEECLKKDLKPILAGRNEDKLKAFAEEFSLPFRCFDLKDRTSIDKALTDVAAVLHCAGPFIETSASMADACLEAGCHYLDITGEIEVFETLKTRHQEFVDAGICVVPGVGFDVVPSDCLAAMLKQKLPDASHLRLAFQTRNGGISPGTLKTMITNIAAGSCVRDDGKMIRIGLADRTTQIPFERGTSSAVSIPWGDVATAFHSRGIPNIEVFLGVSQKAIQLLSVLDRSKSIVNHHLIKAALMKLVEVFVKGPTKEVQEKSSSELWGEVTNLKGTRISGRLVTPEGYFLTAKTAVASLVKVLETKQRGYFTPSQLFGPEFILQFEGVRFQWLKL
jgi:short subunit dehydrogenase-like uncharacterized protein